MPVAKSVMSACSCQKLSGLFGSSRSLNFMRFHGDLAEGLLPSKVPLPLYVSKLRWVWRQRAGSRWDLQRPRLLANKWK
eukprot:7882829-Heterocapsa_arctica.AAC.1